MKDLYVGLITVFAGNYILGDVESYKTPFPGHARVELEEDFIGIGCPVLEELQAAKNIACYWDKDVKETSSSSGLYDTVEFTEDSKTPFYETSYENLVPPKISKDFLDKIKEVESWFKD